MNSPTITATSTTKKINRKIQIYRLNVGTGSCAGDRGVASGDG